jgi:sugar lactone lactonase YvrE
LGEGILWNEIERAIWWTDIQERRLHRCALGEKRPQIFALSERLGSFGFVAQDDRLIAAFESGIAFYQPKTGAIEWITRIAHDAANVRLNDGRVDRRGCFWAGSMVEGGGEPKGKLYRVGRGGQVTTHLDQIGISNSLCFSPDGKHVYFADTPRRTIWRFDQTEAGALSNRRVFAQTPEGAFPDGSNVDAAGFVWNAQWGASKVVRYAPDGSIDFEVVVPASQPTCVAFGGDGLDLLLVSSAREDLDEKALAREPQAGDVFVYQTNVRGLVEPRYIW